MAAAVDVAYSYRRTKLVIGDDPPPDAAVLAQIEQLLVSAASAYRLRLYLDAIRTYEEARTILWGQLYPGVTVLQLPDVDLLRSFVSYGCEWLNVLPIEETIAGVRPREVAVLEKPMALGLRCAAVGITESAAVADLELAATLQARGNDASASFFRARAEEAAPDLVKLIQTVSSNGAVSTDRLNPAGNSVPVGHLRAPITGLRGMVPGRTAGDRVLSAPVGSARAGAAERLAAPVVEIPFHLTVDRRAYSFESAGAVHSIEWVAGEAPDLDTVIANVYDARRLLEVLPDLLLAPQTPSDAALALAHAWYYETPLGLAECYHAVGDWASAEHWYKEAAGYQYINTTIESPYVWTRLATLYLDWGNSYFRDDDAPNALAIYENVVKSDGTEPPTALYTIAGLAAAAIEARDVIANLSTPDAITARPSIASVVLDVWAQLLKISGSLDFWGHYHQNVPIWTFDYLQSVASNFCQLAISAERDAMSFWEKADMGQLTRLQLSQNVTLSKAERDAAQRQVDAARAELDAYTAAGNTAERRAADARANAAEYTAKSWDWTMHQALSAQLGGGEDGNGDELNQLADQMMQGSYSISGDRGTLAAAEQLTSARTQRDYDIDSLNRQADELDLAAVQAAAETDAAKARVAATQASAAAANVRVNSAEQLVSAFDQQRFTPDVWNQLGTKMSALSGRYLDMALDIAKRMQRAYNFENDVSRAIIKSDYAADTVNGFLAADCLMADVQSFTYDLLTSTAAKSQPVRQTISLAQRYPFLFETQLRATGHMEFQTTFDDFDMVYPGTYAGRIEHVEISVDGIVPARGISGTLTNDGVSSYRVPQASIGGAGTATKFRVQARETLIVSDYDVRADALVVDDDPRRRRIFEGAGLASSWTLDLPMDVNELDFQALVDVRLTFTHVARYDPTLRATVLADLAARPQTHERQRPLPLRWLFPDAFFSFYGSGTLSFALDQGDFAAVERDPTLTGLSLIVVTSPRPIADGVVLRVSRPGGAPVTVTTAADGTVAAGDLAALAGASALGEYEIEVTAADNPTWVTNGRLDLDAIDNIALIVGYSFTPRS